MSLEIKIEYDNLFFSKEKRFTNRYQELVVIHNKK